MPPRPRDAHDALVDARHNLLRFQLMTSALTAAGAALLIQQGPGGARRRWKIGWSRPVTMDG